MYRVPVAACRVYADHVTASACEPHFATNSGMRVLQPLLLILLILSPPLAGDAVAVGLEQRLRGVVEQLSSPGSRVTGYPGCDRAADYLTAQLAQAGVEEILAQPFQIPVPVDEGFWLQAGDESIRLHAVWPNLVRTSSLPKEGLTGQLVDAGDDVLTHLESRAVAGRIVLLDYDSGTAWTDAFNLGAGAVIFLETGRAHRHEASRKFLGVPANMPRLYATAADTSRLRALARDTRQVRLRGRMTWQSITGRNIVGIIEGRDPELRGEAVVLAAYYDAMSPVPALAPGAEQACSAASLLELTRVLVEQGPRRTVVLVLSPGHFQYLAGMRHFVPLIQRSRRVTGGGTDGEDLSVSDAAIVDRLADLEIRMLAGLDLSSGSHLLGVGKPTTPYRTPLLAPPISARVMNLVAAYEDSALDGRLAVGNGLRQDLTRLGVGELPHVLPMDASVAALAGCPSLSFHTLSDSRARCDSPLDRPGQVDFPRLARQVDLLACVLPRLLDDPDLEAWDWGNDVFGTIRGEVVHYGARSYLPDRPTRGALVRVRVRQPTLVGMRPDLWAVADDSGRFTIPGVETRIIYTRPVRLEAYGLDSTTGAITDAPDWGINGERRLPGRSLTIQMDDHEEEVQIVTAPMRGLALVDIFEPRNLLTPERLEIIDATTEAEPPVHGACLPLTPPEMELFGYKNWVGSWIEPTAVLFAPPGTRAKLVMATGEYGLGRRLLLLNGSEQDPEGVGFPVDDEGILPRTAYRVALDLQALNDHRIGNLKRHGVRNTRLTAFSDRSRSLLAAADAARAQHRHRDFIEFSRRAWTYAISAYRDVDQTRSGVIKGALFLLAMMLPFAHFCERLLFGFADVRRQVIAYFGLFLAGFLVLSQLHPAFDLSISPVVILLGFVILTLGLLVTSIGISRLNRELKELARGRRQGADTRRSGAMMTSVAVGLAHLRRRPLRTGLTCLTLVLLTFAVLSFTSIQATLRANWIDVEEEAAYPGALVRMREWKAMEMRAYEALRDRFGHENTAPRAWASVASLSGSFRIERADEPARAAGVLGLAGLTARESELTAPQRGLVAGRWLAEGEEDVCLLPTGVADSLGIVADEVGRTEVRLFGETFRVIGLLSPEALDRHDLNGEPLTPLDPEAQQPVEAEVGSNQSGQAALYTHLPGSQTAVLPCAALLRWEKGTLRSVGVRLPEGPALRGTLEELAETVDLNLFVGLEGGRYLVNTVGIATVSGLGSLIVPVGIAALVVLNTMLGSVYERTREIGTFNAVGLAPTHVSGLFMAEAVAFAVIGAVAGYLLGQAAAQVMGHFQWLQGLQLNYSSMSAVLTLGLVIGLVVLSALYPSRLAGQICTPGIERRWRPPAPEGDRLHLQLPFTLVRRDALGMAAFQAEFWETHQEQSIGAGFYVESLRVGRDGDRLTIEARTWLAPFDQGVVQEVLLEMAPGVEPRYLEIDVTLSLVSGDLSTWTRVSRTFLDDLRRQFLLWRALSPEDREAYVGELDRWLVSEPEGR
ncbi:FtsX-like permease family protein [Candidatus Latescibacterota bacterium]